MKLQKITPFLWFDGQAEEAAHYYVSVFGGSVDHVSYYPEVNPSPSPLPGGSVLLVEFTREPQPGEPAREPAVARHITCCTGLPVTASRRGGEPTPARTPT